MTKRDSAEASQNISKAHVDSFDTFIRVGLTRIVESIEPVTVTIDSSNSLKCWFDDVQPWDSSRGPSDRHSPIAMGHLGWNLQPNGGDKGEGNSPSSACSSDKSFFSVGTSPSRA